MENFNKIQIVGLLKEMNLQIEEVKDVELKNFETGKTEKVDCKRISKKEFKNPAFTVAVKKENYKGDETVNEIGIEWNSVTEYVLNENGEVEENSKYKALETVMNTYICGETRVKVDGTLKENAYASMDEKSGEYKFKSVVQISGYAITSTGVPETDCSDGEISGVVHNMLAETRQNGDETVETGRLIVNLDSFNYVDALFPVKFVVEDDLASDFADAYEEGQSVKFNYEVNVRTVGRTVSASAGKFGRRNTNMVSGFNVTELSVFSGEEPFTEESPYYISEEKLKEALDARDVFKEKKIKEKMEKDSEKNAKPTAKKPMGSANKSTPFGNASTSFASKPKASPFGNR